MRVKLNHNSRWTIYVETDPDTSEISVHIVDSLARTTSYALVQRSPVRIVDLRKVMVLQLLSPVPAAQLPPQSVYDAALRAARKVRREVRGCR